jgi:hypothetical protein
MRELPVDPILEDLKKALNLIEKEMSGSDYIPHLRELIRIHSHYTNAINELKLINNPVNND